LPPTSPAPATTQQAALDAARTQFEARATSLREVAALRTAAMSLDALEDLCAAGSFERARTATAGAIRAGRAADTALMRLPSAVTAYDASVVALDRAARLSGLSPAQASALRALSATALEEQVSLNAVARSQHTGWPAYRSLAAAEQLWVTRAASGYYPDPRGGGYDPHRAAAAFVVLVNPFRAALDRERASLATISAALSRAERDVALALATVNAAFAAPIAGP
jgi:hypothetical protein